MLALAIHAGGFGARIAIVHATAALRNARMVVADSVGGAIRVGPAPVLALAGRHIAVAVEIALFV
jgi:hypothetical protein